jgi:hypothetical protein
VRFDPASDFVHNRRLCLNFQVDFPSGLEEVFPDSFGASKGLASAQTEVLRVVRGADDGPKTVR